MLHTKFQGHRPFGSREEDFLRFLPCMGMAAILVMWPGPFEKPFVPPFHGGFIWNLTLTGQAVSEENMFKKCGWQTKDWQRQTDDGRQRPTYRISSPVSLRLRWAKNATLTKTLYHVINSDVKVYISIEQLKNQRTIGPVSLTWVLRICRMRTNLEIH